MRKLLSLLACLLLLPCAALAQDTLTIIHVTDMHYLSPALTDYGEGFMEIIRNADGKVTHYTPQLMQAFVEDMLALQPDAVLLTGDLTLNGARISHEELAALLAPLTSAGIRVLALPGNHDTNAPGYSFSVAEIIPVDGLENAVFPSLYASLGYDAASSRDAASMSYVAPLSPDVWALMLDVNANGTAGTVREETFAWVEEQLLSAQEAGITVIAASHQPALIHNRLFTFGYVINNNTRLLELYDRYGVQVNLCGHLHMQHIARSGALTEIAGSSLAVSPHQYGVLRLERGRLLDYATQPVEVSAWAARTGLSDPSLLDFAAYSAAFFNDTTLRQSLALLAEIGLDPAQQEQLAAFAASANAGYFAGDVLVTPADPAWALWQEHAPTSFFTHYLRSILAEDAAPMNTLTWPAD